jgi:hypothetical protein
MFGIFFIAPKRCIRGLSSCFFKSIPEQMQGRSLWPLEKQIASEKEGSNDD